MAETRISSLLDGHIDVAAEDGDPRILLALRSSGCRFALVRGPGGEVHGLLTQDAQGELSRSRPLVVLDADPDTLETATLLDLAQELTGDHAVGAVVVDANGPVGVIARDTLIRTMPLDLFTANRQRNGTPDVPSLRYRCGKCDPPSVRLLRTARPGDEPPRCSSDFFHGPMERVAS